MGSIGARYISYIIIYSRIHLWDLGAGDIYPAHTVQFGDTINSFRFHIYIYVKL